MNKISRFGFAVALLGVASVAFALTTGTLMPVSDSATQWTPSSGSTHYVLVDEASCNGTTDYVSTNTVGNKDSYYVSLAGIANYSTITGISITPCASNNKGGGSSTFGAYYRWNGVESATTNYSLSGTTPVDLSAANYTGLSLLKTSSSQLNIGGVLVSGTKGARMSRISAVITYDLPTAPDAPTNLSATLSASSSTAVVLNWTDNSNNEEKFKIERSDVSSSGPWTQIASTTLNVTSYSDYSVSTGNTYYYQVRASNAGGDSAYTNVASISI